jgi:hypothetical protein
LGTGGIKMLGVKKETAKIRRRRRRRRRDVQ